MKPAAECHDSETPFFLIVIMVAILGFVPLVISLRIVPYEGIVRELIGQDFSTDFFTWYKMAWLTFLTSCGLIWFNFFENGKRQLLVPIPLIVYGAMAVLSTVFSAHPSLAIWGDPERCEGIFVHLCYVLAAILFLNFARTKRTIRIILVSFWGSIFLLSLSGTLQFFGYDYLFSDIGTKFLIPYHIRQSMPDYSMEAIKKSITSIFLTFGNGNYAGCYLVMAFPLTFASIFAIRGKKQFLVVLANICVYVCLLGTNSRSATITACFSLILLLFLFRRLLRSCLRALVAVFAAFLLVPFVMDAYTLRNDLPRFFSRSIDRSIVRGLAPYGVFKNLKLEKEMASVFFDNTGISFKFHNGLLECFDLSGNIVAYKLLKRSPNSQLPGNQSSQKDNAGRPKVWHVLDETKLLLGEKQLKKNLPDSSDTGAVLYEERVLGVPHMLQFEAGKMPGFSVYVWPEKNIIRIARGGAHLFLIFTEDGFCMLNHRGAICELREVESWGFVGYEGFGSGRGYIWSRSIPLLKKTLITGFGPDNFIANFPNYDLLGKLRFWETLAIVIEKPHNMYLQIALNIGVLALVFLTVFWFRYLLAALRLYWNCDFAGWLEIAGAAIFVAILSYLINGIFNDSIIGIAQVFWALIGMGISVNSIIVAERRQKKPFSAGIATVSLVSEGR